MTIDELKTRIRIFADERDWNQFHSPKNLSMALCAEAAEILEHFQWLTENESRNLSPKQHAEIEQEIGDVLIYLLRLADRLSIDPLSAAEQKLELNAQKYPVDKAKGTAKKYTDL